MISEDDNDWKRSDDDVVPVSAIRDSIRRSLESGGHLADGIHGPAIDLQTEPPLLPLPLRNEMEIGPPRSLRTQHGLLTGFQDFDRIVGGLRKGEIITIAGLPSSGTSTLLQNFVRRSIRSDIGRSVAFFTLDTTRDQVVRRLLGAEAKIDWHAASRGVLREGEMTRLTEAVQALGTTRLLVNEDRFISPDAIYDLCAPRKKGSLGLDLIVLDRINVLGMDYSGATIPLSKTMDDLKAIALELAVPVLVSFTADIAAVENASHRLRVCSLPPAVQVYSDILTLLYRPDQWKAEREEEPGPDLYERQKGLEIVELNVARQTDGPSDTLRLAFNSRWGRFDNVLWD